MRAPLTGAHVGAAVALPSMRHDRHPLRDPVPQLVDRLVVPFWVVAKPAQQQALVVTKVIRSSSATSREICASEDPEKGSTCRKGRRSERNLCIGREELEHGTLHAVDVDIVVVRDEQQFVAVGNPFDLRLRLQQPLPVAPCHARWL